MSSKPVDVEFSVKQKPRFRITYDATASPTGPLAQLKQLLITSNPKIPGRVDKVVSDTELKAQNALLYLYKHDFDENFLAKALRVGNFGMMGVILVR